MLKIGTLDDPAVSGAPLQLWGGHECTINRVQDAWFDQTVRAGHEERLEDIGLFAELGIRKLRYPILWERVSPLVPEHCDFAWLDQRLSEIRRVGMDPIATLCHHGSGPHYTSLLEDSFAPGLARHAAVVAERYPWITDYTPVNEPLTTARFSALYGFWYPHERDESAFWLALLNEIDATRLSMRAIRRFNPAARLIQTDDLGFCHATPPLQEEADFQNERRWMGWDLSCGMVTPDHPLWDRLVRLGFGERLRRIADDPCPPDVIGINHYLSSERLLDHRVEMHEARGIGDRDLGTCNGVQHVDVDAVRSLPDGVLGLGKLIEQAWERYGRSLALTECHYGSTRDEQARWFIAAWDELEALRRRGVDIGALTAWSLLGSYDWNRMVTTTAGHYEPGVYDVRDGQPRPTLMVRVLQELAAGRRPHGPGLDVSGWWQVEQRRAGMDQSVAIAPDAVAVSIAPQPPLAIVRGAGALTDAIMHACAVRGLRYAVVDEDHGSTLAALRPWAVFDARLIEGMPSELSLISHCRQAGLLHAAVVDAAADFSTLGSNELRAKSAPLFFAEDDTFEARALDMLDDYRTVTADGRLEWHAAYAPCVIDGVLDLLLDGMTGMAHFLPEPGWTQADVARALAAVAGHEPCRVIEVDGAGPCCREESVVPSYLPCLDTMLERFVNDRRLYRRGMSDAPEMMLEAAE